MQRSHLYRHIKETHGEVCDNATKIQYQQQQQQQRQQQQQQHQQQQQRQHDVVEFNFARDIERNTYNCMHCQKSFNGQKARDDHEKRHNTTDSKCIKCGQGFARINNRKQHEKRCQAATPSGSR